MGWDGDYDVRMKSYDFTGFFLGGFFDDFSHPSSLYYISGSLASSWDSVMAVLQHSTVQYSTAWRSLDLRVDGAWGLRRPLRDGMAWHVVMDPDLGSNPRTDILVSHVDIL